MNESMRATCSTCTHFRRKPENLQECECLRYPPTTFIVSALGGRVNTMGMYTPVQHNTVSCGEYEPNKQTVN